MFKALIKFRDTDGYVYAIGEAYPHGYASCERIKQLRTDDNRLGRPVIELVDVDDVDCEHSTTVDANTVESPPTAFDGMTKAQLLEYAQDNGIQAKQSMSKAEILEAVRGVQDG